MSRLQDKIALITGAAQGLGAATAALFADNGARLVLTDVNLEGVSAVAEAINAQHGENTAVALEHDVTNSDAWQQAIAAAKRMGGLHVLVNNAGIGSLGGVTEESLENFRRVHEVDVDSVFMGCKYAMPLMSESGGGSIVNISSVAGIIASQHYSAYNSAKAAVRHLSKSVALDCASKGNGIRCNSVHPAFVDTPILDGIAAGYPREVLIEKLARQIPLGRIGKPDDVAYGVLYLASDESGFVTGTELVIDGGICAR
ncbi:MAG: SDR family oxidoreductase [Pseudomonadota bacterium]